MRRAAQLFWKVILPALILGAISWYFYDKLRKPELWAGSIHLRFEWLIPSAILYVISQAVWGVFSIMLLHDQGARISWAAGMRAYFVSQFGKYLPGKVWVLVLRVRMLGNIGISKTAVGITATYEALTSMAAGVLIGVLLLPFLAAEQMNVRGTSVYWVAPFALMPVAMVGLNRFVNRVNRWRKGPGAAQLPRVKLHMVLFGLLQASVGWVLLGLSLWMCVNGLHDENWAFTGERVVHLVAINAIAYVIGFLAVMMPAGGGIREIALQSLLTLELALTMPRESAEPLAAVTAIVLRLLWTVAELLTAGALYHLAPSADVGDLPPVVVEIPNE
ncbi:lysylphosphatidylglycerol synthase transmembrane domain-containing protein [Zavarzinella formosa]|uniref:lysylphosphatidylglycerol synthase transmembrane domain-containing protein n=1 Tax=Zavarzinella formosa TaxID=360055 RepID=UPI00037695DC|nr:lysylphosphatidylglycerol synthase transmembrane domain-containing protein [Zavarzinella formosa]